MVVSHDNPFQSCICEECGAVLKNMLAYRKHKFHHAKNLKTSLRKLESVKAKLDNINGEEEELLVKSWTWKERKKMRESGQAYINSRAAKINKKSVKPIFCSCYHKCTQNFTDEEREQLFQNYWNMDYGEKRRYVHEVVFERPCKRNDNPNSRRNHTLEYTLNGKRVCKRFFCATLDITDRIVMHCKMKARQNIDVAVDLRGAKTAERMKRNKQGRMDFDSSS